MTRIKIAGGKEVLQLLYDQVLQKLRELLVRSPDLLWEFWEKCQDPEHQISEDGQSELYHRYCLVDEHGNIYPEIKDIMAGVTIKFRDG